MVPTESKQTFMQKVYFLIMYFDIILIINGNAYFWHLMSNSLQWSQKSTSLLQNLQTKGVITSL